MKKDICINKPKKYVDIYLTTCEGRGKNVKKCFVNYKALSVFF